MHLQKLDTFGGAYQVKIWTFFVLKFNIRMDFLKTRGNITLLPRGVQNSVQRNVGHRRRNCHHDEDQAAGDCSYPHVAGLFVENSVEDGQQEHHYNQAEHHVDKQPNFVVVAPVAVERGAGHEVAHVVDKQNKR